MALELKVSVAGQKELMDRFGNLPKSVHDALLLKVYALDLKLEARVKAKLSGEVLNVKTGALRRSIFATVEDTGTAILGKVASSGDVKYAALHEFGGKTAAHDILPNKAKALAFMMGGKQVFAKVVHHPGSQMPERSYLRSSLTEMKDQIFKELTGVVRRAVKNERNNT